MNVYTLLTNNTYIAFSSQTKRKEGHNNSVQIATGKNSICRKILERITALFLKFRNYTVSWGRGQSTFVHVAK